MQLKDKMLEIIEPRPEEIKILKEWFKELAELREEAKKLPYGHKVRVSIDNKIKAIKEEIREFNSRPLISLSLKSKRVNFHHSISSLDFHEAVVNHYFHLKENLQNQRKNKKVMRLEVKRFGNVTYKMCRSVHEKPNSILDISTQRKANKVFEDKKPKDDKEHVGIEIEFACVLPYEEVAKLLYKENLADFVKLNHEYVQGRHGNELEYELAILAPKDRLDEIITKVCDILNEQLDANVTHGCGLHVHIDLRKRDKDIVFDNLFKSQMLLYNMVPYLRRRNKFCKIMKEKEWFPLEVVCECEEEDCGHEKKPDRYFGLNTWSVDKYNTFEVRIHSGTSNPKKILNWIYLLLSIADGKIKDTVFSVGDLEKYINISPSLKKYVQSRLGIFEKDYSEDINLEENRIRLREFAHTNFTYERAGQNDNLARRVGAILTQEAMNRAVNMTLRVNPIGVQYLDEEGEELDV